MSDNLTHLARRFGLNRLLFDELARRKRQNGRLTEADIRELADRYLIGVANVYGTASAYDFLLDDSSDVYVCDGTACMLAGTQESLRKSLESRGLRVGKMVCLGRCHENHAFHYRGKNYSGVDHQHLDAILSGTYEERNDEYGVYHVGTPLLTGQALDAERCRRRYEEALQRPAADLLDEVRQSRLRGRGGAGFPMHIKLESVRSQDADEKYIVCNADEGDPGAYTDRYLLEQRPYEVLLGMALAGYITGAREGVLYIRYEYPHALRVLREAIDVFHSWGSLSTAEASDFAFRFYIVMGQGAYICGEETALLNSIEGKRPEVRTRPPYPSQEGLFGRPTLVNNVETLACLPFIVHMGGEVFASIGTARSTGTKLLSLDGHFQKPGVYEVPMGYPLSELVYTHAGGFRKPVKALQIGGPLCGVVPVSMIEELTIDFESFEERGFLLGHAGVVAIPEDFPMIRYMQHLFAFTAHESCGKCFPCRIGALRGAELLQKAIEEDYRIDAELLDDLLDTLQHGSLCGLGGGLPLPIRNILQHFKEELQQHFHTKIPAS